MTSTRFRSIEDIEVLGVPVDRRRSRGRRFEDLEAWGARQKKVADDATLAVVAHGLLNSLTVLTGTADMIRGSVGERSDEVQCWLERMERHASLIGGVLQDLMRGLPHEAIVALDELTR